MAVHNVPYAAAPFVNRVSELAEITDQLNSADCRLLTLIGPGGIGKTRLAIRVAGDNAERFDDGIYYVPLQPLESSDFIVAAIADVVGCPFNLGGDPKRQLFQYLRDKAVLLVLDNFEHLLDGASLLTEMLEAAPEVKLLVTSREVLSLQEEWLYTVHGLHFPERDDAEQPGDYSAVQLFVERARQVSGNLALAEEHAAVVRVCRLVEGMPLALELAAVWTKSLPTQEIAVEIQRSLNFLSTSLRNVPQRHQSMQAVFEQTWERLSDEERRVFRAMSVFSGGFRREAAAAVTGVSARVLTGLVDKSLLTREPNGRYQIHELLRQYAQTRLEAMLEEAPRIHDLHAAYYARFLDDRDPYLNGGKQREAASEIEADIDNVRAAWSWLIEHARIEALEQAEHPLMLFYTLKSWFSEGADVFEKALKLLDNGDPALEMPLAKALCGLGWMYLRLAEHNKAIMVLERSWQLYLQHNVIPTPGKGSDPRMPLGSAHLWSGNFNVAERLGLEAVRDLTLRNDPFNLTFAYFMLAMIARAQGQYPAARHYAQEGYSQTVISGDKLFAPYCLLEWGLASQFLGDTEDAKQRLQAGYTIRKDFNDPKGMADILTSLAWIASREGDPVAAKSYYEQALALYRDYGDLWGMILSLDGMGSSASALDQYGDARRYLREALQVTSEPMRPRILSTFVGIGELLLKTGRQQRGIELLVLARHHPGSEQETRDRAQRLLDRYSSTEASQQPLTDVDLKAITTALVNELQSLEGTGVTPQPGETPIELLSEREMAVLTRIADGLSNREIADRLFLSVATVKWYITHIYDKLGVESRTMALVRARELKLLP